MSGMTTEVQAVAGVGAVYCGQNGGEALSEVALVGQIQRGKPVRNGIGTN